VPKNSANGPRTFKDRFFHFVSVKATSGSVSAVLILSEETGCVSILICSGSPIEDMRTLYIFSFFVGVIRQRRTGVSTAEFCRGFGEYGR